MESTIAISKKNNFHLLRLILALIVVFVHIYDLTGYDNLIIIKRLFSSKFAIEGFFVVSGFLIFRSFERCDSIKKYFFKRFARIYPAYLLVIILSAFLGSFVTVLPLNEYLSTQLGNYLLFNLSFLNFLQPSLPGVFINNPVMSAVNGSLWTIKIEVAFYILVPFIVWLFKKYRKHQNLFMVGLFSLSTIYVLILDKLYASSGSSLLLLLSKQIPGQLRFFIVGAFLYYNYNTFINKKNLFFLLGLTLLIMCNIWNVFFIRPIAVGLIVIWFTFSLSFFNGFGKHGDYSYGVYLFHFPIIQYLISKGFYIEKPLTDVIITLIIVSITSFASWHLIEKRFIKR